MEPINYTPIAMSDIDPEARQIAVAWVEGFERIGGMEIEQKAKLASDIMNYAIAYHDRQTKQKSNIPDVSGSLPLAVSSILDKHLPADGKIGGGREMLRMQIHQDMLKILSGNDL